MITQQKRILFLCASRSIRALMAASLFSARARGPWDIWHTPVHGSQEERALARQVLDEVGIALLPSSQEIEPTVGLVWDEGIILCSGLAAT
jgi:protein-tyrosine-phosphatase